MEGWFGPKKNQKLSHGGLVLGEGNPIMTGYAGIEVWGGHKKGLVWAKQTNKNWAMEAQFWLVECRGAHFGVEGPYWSRVHWAWGAGRVWSGEAWVACNTHTSNSMVSQPQVLQVQVWFLNSGPKATLWPVPAVSQVFVVLQAHNQPHKIKVSFQFLQLYWSTLPLVSEYNW